MDKFDRLNRETREHKNNQVCHPVSYTSGMSNCGTSAHWFDYKNNQTFKTSNGQFSPHYSHR